jgi:hypothetical protein
MSTPEVLTESSVNFFTEVSTEVLYSSLVINKVSFTIRNEPQRSKKIKKLNHRGQKRI